MANSIELQSLFSICSDKNRFVYEVSGMFGKKYLSYEELEYWVCYNIIQRAKYEKVEYTALQIEDVLTLINEADSKRKAKTSGKK